MYRERFLAHSCSERPLRLKLFWAGALLFTAVLGRSPLQAQEDPTSLAGLIPDGALFVARLYNAAQTVSDLKGTALWDAIVEGPIKQRLKEEGHLEELERGAAEFESVTGLKPGKFFKKLAGRELLLAVFPGKKPRVLLLALGEKGTDAGAVLDKLLVPLRDSGELLFLDPITYKEVRIRHLQNQKGEEFFLLTYKSGSILSTDLALVKHCVDLAQGTAFDPITSNPTAQEVCGDLVEDALFAWYLNVPAVLKLLREKHGPVPRRARPFVKFLRAIKGVAEGTWIEGTEIRSRTRVVVEKEKLPPILKNWWDKEPESCWFARYLPQGEVLAGAALHIDFQALAKAVLKALPPRAKRRAEAMLEGAGNVFLGGNSIVNDLLPALGPDLVVIFTDLDSNDKAPGEVSLLLRIKDPKGFELLKNTIRATYGLVQIAQEENRVQAKLLQDKEKLAMIFTVKGATPTVYLTPQALIVSSSRTAAETIVSWLNEPPAVSLQENIPPFKGFFAGLDFQAAADWLGRNRSWLAKQGARKEKKSFEEAAKDLDTLKALLQRFEAAVSRGITSYDAFEVETQVLVGY